MATATEKQTVTLFVYGTLKRGFVNNHRFRADGWYGAQFLKEAILDDATIFLTGTIPFLAKAEGKSVKGEVWLMDRKFLRDLDLFENGYQRHMVILSDGTAAQAYFADPTRGGPYASVPYYAENISEIGSEYTLAHQRVAGVIPDQEQVES